MGSRHAYLVDIETRMMVTNIEMVMG